MGVGTPNDPFETDEVGQAHNRSAQKNRWQVSDLSFIDALLESLNVTLGYSLVVPEAHLGVNHFAFRHHAIDLPVFPEEFKESE